jgi:hypothetical protein
MEMASVGVKTGTAMETMPGLEAVNVTLTLMAMPAATKPRG